MAKKKSNKTKYQHAQAKAQANAKSGKPKAKKAGGNKRQFHAPKLEAATKATPTASKNSLAHNKTGNNTKQATKNTPKNANKPSPAAQKDNASLYGYTLQAIPCNLTQSETYQAQMELFNQTNKTSPKVWAILAVVSAIGIAGVAYFKGYQTIFFWLLLVGVLLYFVIKFFGMKWYMKREIAKQPFPEQLKDISLGLQSHGLVMSMPQEMAMQQMQQQFGGSKANKSMMTMMKKQAGSDIPWSAMTDWKETPNFFFVMFDVKGQSGSQIIPKRMANDNFPIKNLEKHLKESVKQQG